MCVSTRPGNCWWRSAGSPHARSGVSTPGGVRVREGWRATGPEIPFSLSSNCEGRPCGFPTCARPTRAFIGRALREHGESPGRLPFLFTLLFLPSIERSGRGCPRLRASDEHRFIVRVLRARRAPGRSLTALDPRSSAPVQYPLLLLTPWLSDCFLSVSG